MAGVMLSIVTLVAVWLAGCSWSACALAGVVLVFLAVTSSSWVAVTVALSLLASAVLVLLFRAQPTGRGIWVSLVVCGGLLIAGHSAWERAVRRVQLRDQFAYVSLRERTQPVNETKYLVDTSKAETEYDTAPLGWWMSRARSIESLHRSAVYHFLETPEFGVIRMAYPSLRMLEDGDGQPIVLPDEGELVYGGTSPGPQDLSTVQAQLRREHLTFRNMFTDKERFGSVKDLDQVAGFLPHAITDKVVSRSGHDVGSLFEPRDSLQLVRLQLVGLLYHAEPVVYELDTLPELLNAATAPTRALDDFESRALNKLIAGESIYSERVNGNVQMLGGLLNAESCQACHHGPANQLLGAFSYELQPVRGGVEHRPPIHDLSAAFGDGHAE